MKDVPEISPEIRGLMEEIVADPRSALRLTPRHALYPWLESRDTARTSEITKTAAERHLVAAHREALARILYDGACIAYWKKPFLAHRPTDADGRLLDPAADQDAWISRVERMRAVRRSGPQGLELLDACLRGVEPDLGYRLLVASLSLVYQDEARRAVGEYMKERSPRFALGLFQRLAREAASPAMRARAGAGSGSAMSLLHLFDEAAQAYGSVRDTWKSARFYLFNLACVRGRPDEAFAAAAGLDELWSSSSPVVAEAASIVAQWSRTLDAASLAMAKSTMKRLGGRLPEVASRIGRTYV